MTLTFVSSGHSPGRGTTGVGTAAWSLSAAPGFSVVEVGDTNRSPSEVGPAVRWVGGPARVIEPTAPVTLPASARNAAKRAYRFMFPSLLATRSSVTRQVRDPSRVLAGG